MTELAQNWRDMTAALARKHGLSFTHNPGGGQFYRTAEPVAEIQVHMMDDKADYERLLSGLTRIGLES